jgi:hypothetical protein
MSHDLIERSGVCLLLIATDGPAVGAYRDATDLVGDAISEGVAGVVIPSARLDQRFFSFGKGSSRPSPTPGARRASGRGRRSGPAPRAAS